MNAPTVGAPNTETKLKKKQNNNAGKETFISAQQCVISHYYKYTCGIAYFVGYRGILALLQFQTETIARLSTRRFIPFANTCPTISACRSDATHRKPVVASIGAFRPRRPLAHDSSIARVTRHCLSSLGHRHHSQHVRLFQASRHLRSFIAKAHR